MEDYEWQQLQTTVERLGNVPIFIDDTPGINIFELRAKCRRLKQQYDIQMVIIDYLQLMSGSTDNKGGNRRCDQLNHPIDQHIPHGNFAADKYSQ